MIITALPRPRTYQFRALTLTAEVRSALDGLIFYKLGRFALLAALRSLGIRSGEEILVPALFCESTLGPLRKAGYKLRFLDVGERLNLLPESIRSITSSNERIKCLIFTNYFGLVGSARSEVLSECRRVGLHVIEDCAHSFLTRNGDIFRDTSADATIFSMRKILPIEDGGALFAPKNQFDRTQSDTQRLLKNSTAYQFGRLSEALVATVGWPNIYSDSVDCIKRSIRAMRKTRNIVRDDIELESEAIQPSASLAAYLSDREYLFSTAQARLMNFEFLRGVLNSTPESELKLAGHLPTDLAPQVFPLLDPSGTLVQFMRKRGIGAYQWPAEELPPEVASSPCVYPEANRYNRELVCLPVHQSLATRDLRKLESTLCAWINR